MAITSAFFGLGLLAIQKQSYNLETAAVKLSLHTSTYTPNQDTHDFYNDVSNELSNGSGYTTGGVTLTGVAFSYDATSHEVRLDFNDPSWTFSGTRTWRYGIGYVDTAGASSTDPLIFLLKWDVDQTVSTPYTLTIPATGLLYQSIPIL